MSNFRVTAGRDGSRSFGDHDDRTVSDYSGRGRSRGRNYNKNYGKKGPSKGPYRGRGRGGRGSPGPRSRLEDDDGDFKMGDEGHAGGSRQRYNPYGRSDSRRGSRPRPPSSSHRGSYSSRGRSNSYPGGASNTWYKITIPHGRKSEKEFILNSINRLTDVPVVPVQFHYEHQSAIFHVQDMRVASELRNLSRRITMPNGFKMIILTQPGRPSSHPEHGDMSKEVLEKLKCAMSSRYDPASKALNLSDLYNDQTLNADGIRLPLSKENISTQVLKIIGDNIPELTQLDISKNRISRLEPFASLAQKAPDLIRLNLGNNSIRHETELDRIKRLKLEELFLEGNEMCDRFSDHVSYISAIRRRFPKVIKLDGHELPPPVTFDLEAPSTLPPTLGSHFPNDQVKKLICLFLEQFYHIFDSGNRQPLVDAYHDEAVFSMACFYTKSLPSKQASLKDYFQEGRNMLRLKDSARLHKCLKVGKLNIVSFLAQLPASQHDPSSFVVDVTLSSATLMIFTVHGIFKENKGDPPPMRYFSRTFTTVPQGSGIVITNDEYGLTNATKDQIEKSFRNPAPTPPSSPVPGPSSSTPALTQEVKYIMVKNFSTQSRMNLEWSEKCLVQNDWDYDKAARVFTELNEKGTIPAEAFVKTG